MSFLLHLLDVIFITPIRLPFLLRVLDVIFITPIRHLFHYVF